MNPFSQIGSPTLDWSASVPFPGNVQPLFRSFVMGGIECSTHRLPNGKRLDLIAATQHDRFFVQDFARLRRQGFYTLRSGLRWHLIERTPYHYDFSSVLPMVKAAHAMEIQIIWDIFHYGWPDDLDIMSPAFIDRLAALGAAFTRLLRNETDEIPNLVPINEISFIAWAGGEVGYLNPFLTDQGWLLKRQLVRAAIASIDGIRAVNPYARIINIDPAIHIVADSDDPDQIGDAEYHRNLQFEAWDMLTGRLAPELGGAPHYLDIMGINYYARNQWLHYGDTIFPGDPRYRPFRDIVAELYDRYGRPLFIAETGTEDQARPDWLRYMGAETAAAIAQGVPIGGLCLYPIFNHPGWDNDRHCHNGLWDYADVQTGSREIYHPLADEIIRLQWQVDQAK